jgi:hypothetical protein
MPHPHLQPQTSPFPPSDHPAPPASPAIHSLPMSAIGPRLLRLGRGDVVGNLNRLTSSIEWASGIAVAGVRGRKKQNSFLIGESPSTTRQIRRAAASHCRQTIGIMRGEAWASALSLTAVSLPPMSWVWHLPGRGLLHSQGLWHWLSLSGPSLAAPWQVGWSHVFARSQIPLAIGYRYRTWKYQHLLFGNWSESRFSLHSAAPLPTMGCDLKTRRPRPRPRAVRRCGEP